MKGRTRGALAILAIVAAVACTQGGGRNGRRTDPPAAQTSLSPGVDKPVKPPAFARRACGLPDKWLRYIYRGWDPGRSRNYDVAVVPRPPNYMGSITDTSHSGPYRFLQEIPLVFYGPGHIRPTGSVSPEREITLADVAPTVAELLDYRFPERDGTAIEQVLLPDASPPRLVVTAVIDGGGWNVLDLWKGKWPYIRRLMRRGASVRGAVTGSSPSITPATHSNMSTGAFPNKHGITAIVLRDDEGHLTEAFVPHDKLGKIEQIDPSANTDMPTVADLWDRSVDNKALVGMLTPGLLQFGMMGLGASVEGADKDFAGILSKEQRWATNTRFYALPGYVSDVEGPAADIEAVDRSDGRVDGLWRGHEMPPVDTTPAFAPWQNRVMQSLLAREGFGEDDVTDLFYVNYKAPDKAGHAYNMIAPEQGDVIASVDDAVAEMITWLDDNVGRGEYVFVLTADHGQTPLGAGGWPIRPLELTADLNARFDRNPNGRGIVQDTSAATLFMNAKEMRANDVTPEAVGRFLLDYRIGENVAPEDAYPAGFEGREDERIFLAAIPGRLVDDVHRACL